LPKSSKNLNLLPTLNVEHVDSDGVDGGDEAPTNIERTATFRLFYPEPETTNPEQNPVSETGGSRSELTEPLMPRPGDNVIKLFTAVIYECL
jgi:hypothetical protein